MKKANKITRGERLKQLRMLTGTENRKPLTRAAIERKHSVNRYTLKNWEDGHATGLTENGARKMIDVYQKEYIDCSIHWLLEGQGPAPKKRNATTTHAASPQQTGDPHVSLFQECAYFKKLNPEAVILELTDDAMSPQYLPGDHVGGIRHYINDLAQLIDKDCIVETTEGRTVLRRLQHSTVPERYNLYATNPSSKIELPTIYSTEVTSAAPVMRIWRGKKW